MGECVVCAVEDDVKTLRLCGAEERHRLFIERVSAMEQGDGGEIDRTQFSETAPCRLCGKRFVFVLENLFKTNVLRRGRGHRMPTLYRFDAIPSMSAPSGWLAASFESCSRLRTSFTSTLSLGSTTRG